MFALTSCATLNKVKQTQANITVLKFLHEYVIPFDTKFANTTVGGLSGIDYDAVNDRYFFICDDRSDKNPARIYEGKIILSPGSTGSPHPDTKIDTAYFTNVVFMKQANGNTYPNNKQDPFHTPDPEALRYNPKKHQLIWTSEGERIVKPGITVLEDPSIDVVDMHGKFIDSFPLPENLKMHAEEKGPRQNGVLEGMTFADDYRTLYVNVEEPLYEDGPRADLMNKPYFIRILKFDARTKTCNAQYIYPLSPVAYPPTPADGFKINGVPDILNIGKDKLLVIERSFSTGRLACTIKVFEADLTDVTNVSDKPYSANVPYAAPGAAIPHKSPSRIINKKLLLNMDDLGIYIDNIEGVTFGPTLPNGHKTLIFVADNNFSPVEKAQLLLFEVIEDGE